MAKSKWYIQDKISNKFVVSIGCEWEELTPDINSATYWRTKKNALSALSLFDRLFNDFHNIKVNLQVVKE